MPRLRNLLIGSIALLAFSCVPRPSALHVPIVYRSSAPTEHGVAVETTAESRVYIAPVIDRRSSGEVGVNDEEGGHTVVITDGSPGDFLRSVASSELHAAGLGVVEQSGASRVLALTLTRFFTTEGSTYVTEIRATIEIKSTDGEVLFEGTVTGGDSRWGRSLSPENYQESWSAASVDLVRSILRNPRAVSALSGASSTHSGPKGSD